MATLSLVAALAMSPASARGETAYISDTLTVPLRSGPSNANRILHRGLPSGTRLEILGRDGDSGFVQIRTDRGTEGWLPGQYLVDEPIARDRLVAANRRIRELSDTVQKQETTIKALSSGKTASEANSADLSRQVKSLQSELAEIKRISAGAIAQNETNKELMALNDRLRTEVDELVGTISGLEDNVQERWLLIGGGLVLAGLLIGIAIKARPRRSAWN
ncbi:MAG: TIGR04211 family SH3 domain-containing protein [Pseudomonadota bacterium]